MTSTTHTAIASTLRLAPWLTLDGRAAVADDLRRHLPPARLHAARRRLLAREQAAFEACVSWLKRCRRRANVNRHYSTYAAKHAVEDANPGLFIPEGVLTLAALTLGFKATPIANSSSCWLNLTPPDRA